MLGIYQCDHSIQYIVVGNVIIHKEGLRNWPWMMLHTSLPQHTGERAELKNIDAWLRRLEAETCFNDISEKELNIVK